MFPVHGVYRGKPAFLNARNYMPETLCEKYGFDHKHRQQRLLLVGLSSADLPLAGALNEKIIAPNVNQVVEDFYSFLFSHEATHRFLDTGPRIKKLQQTQTEYLLTLGRDFDTPAYFEERLRVGQTHDKIGLPFSLYQSAYGWLQDRLFRLMLQSPALDPAQREALQSFLIRVVTLDMSLATETYYFERVADLQAHLFDIVSQRDELTEKVERDTLTGVASRVFILAQLEKETQRLSKTSAPLSVIMADLDFFKKVNDEHGHLVGDRVLREVGRRLNAAVRQVDWVGRYGGEEFLLVLPGTHLELASMIADRARQSVAATPIHTQEATICMTVSMGVTEAQTGDSVETLIHRADDALYQAKHSGRNCVKLR
jgi:diguanylate cyclase (GGDEF)-like protein